MHAENVRQVCLEQAREAELEHETGGAMRKRRVFFVLLLLSALSQRRTVADAYDPPAGYYNTATGTSSTLKSQLNNIIDGHTTRSYDQLRSDLQITDVDPNNSSRIVLIYNNRVSIAKPTGGSPAGWDSGVTWNREHSWPQSRGIDTTSAPDGSDLHHLFPSDPDENSLRGNLNFGGVFGAQQHGLVNDSGTKYYPGDLDAGMVARAQFYMAVRYDGVDSGTADLELVTGNPADSGTTLGDLNRLIEWHFAAPPDTYERRRNETIYDNYQANRNPFIDHPEYAWSIFMNQANNSQISITGTTVGADGNSARNVDLGRVFVGASVPAAQAFTLNKAGTNGTYFQVTTNGAATSSLSGHYNAMRSSQTDSKSITIGLSTTTAAAGLKSGTVTIDNIDITTGGGVGRGANDANDTFDVSLTVLDHSTPSFAAGSMLATLTHDFGQVAIGGSAPSFSFDVFNLLATAGYTANMDFDSVASSGNTTAFTTNLGASAGALVLAGGASQSFSAALTSASVGSHSASYVLNFSDENIVGAISKSITLNLSGVTYLAGDYNDDLVVDASDYTAWRGTLGQSVAAYSGADGNGDGMISEADFDVWRANFGQAAVGSGSAIASTSVPEPAGVFTAVFAVTAAAVSRRPRRVRPTG